MAHKTLIRKKDEITEKYQDVDREFELALEEAKSLMVERIYEARNRINSIVSPPPLSVVVWQKPDERVLLPPEGAKFKFNIPFQPSDKTSVYLFILGAFFILMPWSSALKLFLFLSISIFLFRRSLKETKRNKKEFARRCVEVEKSCAEYEKIKNPIPVSYFDQLEISKATQSGTEDFVERMEWWRKESLSIVLGEINHALEEAIDTLNEKQSGS
jgi:hypothetical protein